MKNFFNVSRDRFVFVAIFKEALFSYNKTATRRRRRRVFLHWRRAQTSQVLFTQRNMNIRFVFFDLGNVLLHFSAHRLVCQVAQVAETTEELARERLFDEKRYRKYERGEISSEEYWEQVCEDFETKPDIQAFLNALSNVFWANDEMLPIARKLAKCNVPRGILSNTNPAHWSYVENAFPRIWDAFPEHKIASFEVKTLKPFREIYEIAYEDAKRSVPDLTPEQILFIDDLEPNVDAAKEFGFRTIRYADFDQFLAEYKQTNLPIPSRYL